MMDTECTRRCWIAGAIGGLFVLIAVTFFGGSGWLQGLLFGLLTMGLLGGLLVWGVCQGAGTAGDNEALLAGGWSDEPFTPAGRIVRPGGETVPPQTLPDGAAAPHSAPQDSRLVRPADTRRETQPTKSAARQGGDGGSQARRPDRDRPRIVAGAGPDAPVRGAPASAEKGTEKARDSGQSRPEAGIGAQSTGDHDDDVALVQPAPGATGQVARAGDGPVDGMVLAKPHLPEGGGEALTLESSGSVSPRTDTEAGAEEGASEGGIEPLASDADRSGAASPSPVADDAPHHDVGHGTNGAGVAPASFEDGDAAEAAEPRIAAVDRASADDLTRIRGVGPMLQDWLAGYGITRLDQIAAWDDADIARYAGMMGRMGHRIRGEDWVGQARQLAAGGETAHSRTGETD